jgi:DMSO/TMAO reductase YedYZ molybdopterin-dependent catalytic subunit
MNRRYFMTLLSSGMLVPHLALGDHHVISADPLEVEFDLTSLQGQFTSIEDFYIRNHFAAPGIAEPATLKVEGEVDKPLTLTAMDLDKLPEKKMAAVLECAGNRVGSAGLISNGAWSGWAMKDVLAMARPTGSGVHVHLIGRDGYQRSVPLERAMADGILATHLNSRPLTLRHGAPWRALLPGWYGMDSVKWLERIVVATAPLPPDGGTYLQTRQTASGELDRSPLPRILVKSAITDPQQGAILQRGSIPVRGVAWSGAGKIDSVEVSVDGGASWKTATLGTGSDLGWTLWNASVELTQPGAVEIAVRAKDVQGNVQPAQRDPARLDGYTNNWYHRIHCVVV